MRKGLVAIVVCGLLGWVCAGCVVPYPAPKRYSPFKPRFGFLQAGSTTREEVMLKLGWADGGLNQERYFWARWSVSSWAVAYMVPADSGGVAGTDRVFWRTHHLLVEFDERGVVKRRRFFKSEEAVKKELAAWMSEAPKEAP